MNCKESDNLLPAYEEGLLTPGEKMSVVAHLAACERCRRSLADLMRAQELVQGLGEVEPPPFFEERIMSRVRQEAGGKQGLLRRLFYPLHIKIPIQALATVLAAVLAFHVYQQGDPEEKRVAPLSIPLTEPAKEPVAAEPTGDAGAPVAVTPTRPPAGDLPGATRQRFAAPPPEGGGMREKMADSAAVREERPADVIREDRRAPETPPPARMAKTADPGTQVLEMAGEGVGQREGGKSETSGKAALRQETGRTPAIHPPERQAKAKMADAGVANGEGKPMPAAPAPGQAAASGAIGRSAVELTIQVADVHRAMQEIEKLLGEADARIIERRRRGEGEFLGAEMEAGRVALLLGRLAAIGRVHVEKGLPDLAEGSAAIGITIESDKGP